MRQQIIKNTLPKASGRWLLLGILALIGCKGVSPAQQKGVFGSSNAKINGDGDALAGGEGILSNSGEADGGGSVSVEPTRNSRLSKGEQRDITESILGTVEEASACEPQAGIQLLRRLTNAEYRASVVDLLHDDRAGAVVDSFPPQATERGFDNNAQLNVVSKDHVGIYWEAAATLGSLLAEKIDAVITCSKKDEACAQKLINDFGLKVYRRPLSATEAASLLAIYQIGATEKGFSEGVKLVGQTLFNSPHFLYRSEVGDDMGGGLYRLSSYEAVTALSFLLFATTPDTALLQMAAKKPTFSETDVEALATEMLNDPRSAAGIAQFADAYMRVRDIFTVSKKTEMFPQFTAKVREDMAKETRDFFQVMILEQEGSFADLYGSNFSYTSSKPLQEIYGGTLTGEGEQSRLMYEEKERLGLLGHGTFLAGHTHAESTSPVLRGAFVLESVLCDILLPPPPELDVQPPKLDPKLTTQERFKAHSTDPACAGCHVKIDGLGFGLEGYDPIGRFRTTENNKPIDTQGVAYLDDGQPTKFTGAAELGKLLSTSNRAKSCFALQWYRHALGRATYKEDVCQAKKITNLVNNDDKLKKLVTGLLANYGFLNRKP